MSTRDQVFADLLRAVHKRGFRSAEAGKVAARVFAELESRGLIVLAKAPRRRPKKPEGQTEFGESIEYGAIRLGSIDGVTAWGQLEIDEQSAIDLLHKGAAAMLPPGTRYEIRRAIPGNFGRTKGLGWVHQPWMTDEPTWPGYPPPDYEATRGVILIGRYVTPEAKP